MQEELYWLDIYTKYSQQIDPRFGYPFAVYINYPVYHPAVFSAIKSWVSDGMHIQNCGILVAFDEQDAIKQFINIKDEALKNPANVDAAMSYIKNNSDFWKRNNQLNSEYQDLCRSCWTPLSNGEKIIYPCHVIHKKCQNNRALSGENTCITCHEPFISNK